MSKFCLFCGAVNEDGQILCVKCGKELPVSNSSQYSPPPETPRYSSQQPEMQYSSQTQNVLPKGIPNGGTELPMRWFKFIIWVQLILNGVVNVGNGLMSMNGMQYESEISTAEMVYAAFPGLKSVDFMYGLASIALGVFAFVVRNQLAKYKRNAPKFYFFFLGAQIAITLLYSIATTSILSGAVESSQNYSGIAVGVALIIYNISYFKKREHLFVN